MSTTDNGRIPDKTGGSAFPAQFDFTQADDLSRQTGMTLRDYFSGQALIGLVSLLPDEKISMVAAEAYRYSDAMLAARKDSDEAKAE